MFRDSRICIVAVLFHVLIACADDVDSGATRTPNATPRPVLTEERDGIWLDSAGSRRRVTAAQVGMFDFDALAAKQREGEVILYWAAAPVLSPDGRRIAYATNREAVATETGGQSIWLIDLDSGAERALLHERGRSFRPVGWLDDDVAYIGDDPGVWTIDPVTGARVRLSTGTWLAGADDGSALAVADDVPADPRIRVITPTDTIDVPPAPGESVYLAQASFDSAGTSLLLEATPDSGYTRERFVFRLVSGRLEPAP